ncbi:MAG: N-6 DNA methylase [Promethearchaeota archaeon]
MVKKSNLIKDKTDRRTLGVHLTSVDIFLKYIFPEIKGKIGKYIWVDLYAGEGNLVLPILNEITPEERVSFFKNHIYLFDIQSEMIQKCIKNAKSYGIPIEIARKNIKVRNNLENFPMNLKKNKHPIFHITNPPYLYLGYIRKHKRTQKYLKYFQGENDGYQDLYQIAMINDLRNNIENLIYIIPTNFLFGASVSNKFRQDFLKYYKILRMFIFETRIFEFTGTNICIGFFKRKKDPKVELIEFNGVKIKNSDKILNKQYILKPKFKYRAGFEFDEFIQGYRTRNPLIVKYYLLNEKVLKNKGTNQIAVIDANYYKNNEYKRIKLKVNNVLKEKIESNILYVQTVDKGSIEGRVGLGLIEKDFDVKGIYVSSDTYRTHPIQIFLEPQISIEDQLLLRDYFNFMLESFRKKLDSEFLTTYKYSKADYTRKYLGLTQVRGLIETLPIINLDKPSKQELKDGIEKRDFKKILIIIKEKKL